MQEQQQVLSCRSVCGFITEKSTDPVFSENQQADEEAGDLRRHGNRNKHMVQVWLKRQNYFG